ncbi:MULTISPECIES: manganese efflux pump MntP family protein [Prevotellaceae]|jgi:putative Mn2+ efflux pump MntP|uniref:Putative manganese efflux pump MntP n=1 Tax=Xylanibacter rarus TaxID=1676614 RepID=A0A8E1QVZ7_9BACT|nr:MULTISPECIES: manganese efflux pump MntP family protein [Prevotellaceae]KOO67558.1 membrane protein [Xylanibacter rarus]CCX69863.1 putative manganese efflux pump MntP [Prevotella sp. CAG:255]HJH77391.1 manganese efflux pump MntP family protein [Prevotellaceae bacterium]
MSLIDITFLALALAMDCFTVSIVSGVIIRKYILSIILRMAILFGLFQAMMPFIGWLGTSYFSHYLESVDHWIAFGLLAFLGGKMIKDSFGSEEEAHFDPSKLTSQLLFAVATSIDALAVGISFACLGYKNIEQLTLPLIVIGVCSFVMSILGNILGVMCGKSIVKRLKPEFIGGVILLLIGFRILYEHISF